MSTASEAKLEYNGVHHMPLDKIEGSRDKLIGRGVECSDMVNHADVETLPGAERTTDEVDESTWVRSFYFLDPDGIMLEFCADKNPGTNDLTLPVNAEGVKADGNSLLH